MENIGYLKDEIRRLEKEVERLKKENEDDKRSLRIVSRKCARERAMRKVVDDADTIMFIADIVDFFEKKALVKLFHVEQAIEDGTVRRGCSQDVHDAAEREWNSYIKEHASFYTQEMHSFLMEIHRKHKAVEYEEF